MKNPILKAISICKAYRVMAKRQLQWARAERRAQSVNRPSLQQISILKTDYDQACQAVQWLESLEG